jgi:hypothetical protein
MNRRNEMSITPIIEKPAQGIEPEDVVCGNYYIAADGALVLAIWVRAQKAMHLVDRMGYAYSCEGGSWVVPFPLRLAPAGSGFVQTYGPGEQESADA